jgi:hypothetical protein
MNATVSADLDNFKYLSNLRPERGERFRFNVTPCEKPTSDLLLVSSSRGREHTPLKEVPNNRQMVFEPLILDGNKFSSPFCPLYQTKIKELQISGFVRLFPRWRKSLNIVNIVKYTLDTVKLWTVYSFFSTVVGANHRHVSSISLRAAPT